MKRRDEQVCGIDYATRNRCSTWCASACRVDTNARRPKVTAARNGEVAQRHVVEAGVAQEVDDDAGQHAATT